MVADLEIIVRVSLGSKFGCSVLTAQAHAGLGQIIAPIRERQVGTGLTLIQGN